MAKRMKSTVTAKAAQRTYVSKLKVSKDYAELASDAEKAVATFKTKQSPTSPAGKMASKGKEMKTISRIKSAEAYEGYRKDRKAAVKNERKKK